MIQMIAVIAWQKGAAFYFHPHFNITMTGKWMMQMTAAEMKPKVMRQVG